MMVDIVIPNYDLKFKKVNGEVYVFDIIRKKYILLTPEEWIRQHFIHWLIGEYGFPKALFRVEGGLWYDRRQKRSDVLVYDRKGQPFYLLECKSADIALDIHVKEQVFHYNQVINAPYCAISNGSQYMGWKWNSESNQLEEYSEIPIFGALDEV
jgi:type I site-specific restriction endonuclease